ncbi:hypothetical protein [Streptomyces sp. NPDC015414]|uniref:hypothetical protein n=1 Tax=Streptomyces sp. NPDC015414 TaxID=3364957 RepID=UPI003700EFEB
MNYLMDDGVVIGGGSKAHLPQALDGDVVAFEADGTDAADDAAWHVASPVMRMLSPTRRSVHAWPAPHSERVP